MTAEEEREAWEKILSATQEEMAALEELGGEIAKIPGVSDLKGSNLPAVEFVFKGRKYIVSEHIEDSED